MVLATVTLPDRLNYGIHLAIVCTEAPQCETAPDLARFIGSLRLATGVGTTAPVTWGSEDLRELAKDVGVRLPESAAQ
jgi:hypothetical protein